MRATSGSLLRPAALRHLRVEVVADHVEVAVGGPNMSLRISPGPSGMIGVTSSTAPGPTIRRSGITSSTISLNVVKSRPERGGVVAGGHAEGMLGLLTSSAATTGTSLALLNFEQRAGLVGLPHPAARAHPCRRRTRHHLAVDRPGEVADALPLIAGQHPAEAPGLTPPEVPRDRSTWCWPTTR